MREKRPNISSRERKVVWQKRQTEIQYLSYNESKIYKFKTN